MRFDVFTLFPGWFEWMREARHLSNATASAELDLRCHDLRAHTPLRAGQVDDSPYGGGPGMVIRVDVVAAALEAVYGVPAERVREERRVCVLTPRGRPLTDAVARELAAEPEVALLCGRYEGFDERVHEHLADDAVSIGPFVLAGGEVAAMAVVDAVGRRLPGALGNVESLDRESFSEALGGGTEHPHYTRPAEFRGWGVPGVLLSGHHGDVERWRLARVGASPHGGAGGDAGSGADGGIVSAIDHVVLTAADTERSVAFYERALGMRRIEAAPGRVAVGWPGGTLDLHPADGAIRPRAAAPTPGSADLCLRTELPVEAVLARLREADVAIEEGPVVRAGAEGPITSVHVRDPDGNLVEVGAPAPADAPGS